MLFNLPVGRTVVVVVVVEVVVGLEKGLSNCLIFSLGPLLLSESPPATLKRLARSILTPPDFCKIFSIEIGVVATDGHPVNSVVALKVKKSG